MKKSADQGSATVISVVLVAVLLVLCTLLVSFGAAVITRRKAQTVADLAALAGAVKIVRGTEQACAAARSVVENSRAHLLRCVCQDWEVFVEISVKPSGNLPLLTSVHAQARAGPGN